MAAAEAPRELYVAAPVCQLVAGSVAAPGFLDRRLARAGYDGQQSDGPAIAGRSDNLFQPVDRDFGTRGRFGIHPRARARSISGSGFRGAVAFLVAAPALLLALTFARHGGRR